MNCPKSCAALSTLQERTEDEEEEAKPASEVSALESRKPQPAGSRTLPLLSPGLLRSVPPLKVTLSVGLSVLVLVILAWWCVLLCIICGLFQCPGQWGGAGHTQGRGGGDLCGLWTGDRGRRVLQVAVSGPSHRGPCRQREQTSTLGSAALPPTRVHAGAQPSCPGHAGAASEVSHPTQGRQAAYPELVILGT